MQKARQSGGLWICLWPGLSSSPSTHSGEAQNSDGNLRESTVQRMIFFFKPV